jgi:acetylornithine/succinyldiaminopimelate/putrescine aminotransferase
MLGLVKKVSRSGQRLARGFHDLPRRKVMAKCALPATTDPVIAQIFNEKMGSNEVVMSTIQHRGGNGDMNHGAGPERIVKEAVSGSILAQGNLASAKEIEGWINNMIARENRTLENGIDIVFLDQLLASFEKLKSHPKLVDVMITMANECHKPAVSIDVEMGEFLYGLSDTFNIIKEAHDKRMTCDTAYLSTNSGRSPKRVVGGHPSNFVVYISPILEAICMGWPCVLLNHPSVPTAATQMVGLLEECGVDFKGKLVQTVPSNTEDLCSVYSGSATQDISQGILIAGLDMGRQVGEVAPNTKQELSGSNELITSPHQYRMDPKGFLDSLKMNLGYSAGKQCTAPSKMIFCGFEPHEVSAIQSELQSWSNDTHSMPARQLTDFTSHMPYLFNNDDGNESQFSSSPNQFEEFVTGPRRIFKQLDPKINVQEVFGPATAIAFRPAFHDVQLSRHSLSMGINVCIQKERDVLLDFFKEQDFKYLPAIINVGYGASTLAATPTGEPFLPWHYTLSGQDTGMGPHAPLRFNSFQVSKDTMMTNAMTFASGNILDKYRNFCECAAKGMSEYPDIFAVKDISEEVVTLLSNAVESDKSLLPTLNARLINEEEVKMTLYMPIKIGSTAYVRLTNEDTPEIRKNMIRYICQWHRQGIDVDVSISPDVENKSHILAAFFDACVAGSGKVTSINIHECDDNTFIKSLEGEPHTVLTADEDFKCVLKKQNHFLTVFPPSAHSPFGVVGVKPQTVKVSGNADDCKQLLLGFIQQRIMDSPATVTKEHLVNQMKEVDNQIIQLRKLEIIAKYQKYSTGHYTDKLEVVADKMEGVRIIEADKSFYYDCNLAYGAARAGFDPDVPLHESSNSALPSQAMYTERLSGALEALAERYAPVIHSLTKSSDQQNASSLSGEDVKVLLLNTGGEITDSVQQAVRRFYGESTVILYPKNNFNGRRAHANRLNFGNLPDAVGEDGKLNVDEVYRCFIEFNDSEMLDKVVECCKNEGKKAAIIWEPVQGEGGVNVSSPEYIETLKKHQANGDLLIVADEVQTGLCGPANSKGMLSAYLGVKPSVLMLAKALTLGRMAGSCAVMCKDFAEKAYPPGVDGGTFSGSPVVSDLIIKADEFWHDNGGANLDTLHEIGEERKQQLRKALQENPNDYIKEVKGIGPMGGVEFVSSEVAHHYHDVLISLGEHLKEAKDPHAPVIPDERFKGIIQKLSGKSGEVMRMTSGLAPPAEQANITKLLKYVLTSNTFKPTNMKIDR